MSALSSLSIEALSASVQLDDNTESILFAVVPDRAAFEAVVQALRDDWLTISDVRLAVRAKDLIVTDPEAPGAEAVWLDDATTDEELARIDPMRTALIPKRMTLVGCTRTTHDRLRRAAPHFCSSRSSPRSPSATTPANERERRCSNDCARAIE